MASKNQKLGTWRRDRGFHFSNLIPDRLAKMFTGAGSGLYQQTALGDAQVARSITLQDTRRSIDQITWRRLLAYARQIHTNCGEIRGAVLERATMASLGGWFPKAVGKNTPKEVRDKYENFLWDWMQMSDLRGEPYDFYTDKILESIMLDRDGESPFIFVYDENGLPRIQYVANHRIYSHVNSYAVTEPGPYFGMRFNNGVVYDELSRPVAYFVLEESLQYTQAIKGKFVPVGTMRVPYNPDWCDQGRGVTAYAHAIRRIFDLDDINGYLLIGVKRNAALPILNETESPGIDPGENYISTGSSPGGTAISLQELQGAGLVEVRAGSQSKITIPHAAEPDPNVPDYMEYILLGAYQGLEWPYEYTRVSKESKGANIRVTCEKVNNSLGKQFRRLRINARHQCAFVLAWGVDQGILPPGEWWALDFPMPPEVTPDRWRQSQEDREDLKFGTTSLQRVAASRGFHWRDDLRKEKDEEIDDLLTRCKAIQKKHSELELREIIDIYRQSSANPGLREGLESDPEAAGDEAEESSAPAKKPAKKKED